MPTNLRELLAPIVADAVQKAVDGYRRMLLGEDPPAAMKTPGHKPKDAASVAEIAPAKKRRGRPPGSKNKVSATATAPSAAAAQAKPAGKKSRKRVRRDSGAIAQLIEDVFAFIQAHAGLGALQIAKKVGGDKLAISDALKRLRATKRVVTTGERSKMTYVAGEGVAAKAVKKSHKKRAGKKAA